MCWKCIMTTRPVVSATAKSTIAASLVTTLTLQQANGAAAASASRPVAPDKAE